MTKDVFKKASQLQHDVEVMEKMEYIIDDTVTKFKSLFSVDIKNGSKEALENVEKYSKSVGDLFEALVHDCPDVGISMTVEVLEQLKTSASKQKETMTEDFKQL